MIFPNRQQAGKKLIARLVELKGKKQVLVLAISPGGLMVAKELAKYLACPLDLLILGKVRLPQSGELAVGWVGSIGRPAVDHRLLKKLGIKKTILNNQLSKVKKEVEKKEKILRRRRPELSLQGKTVVLVDDGIATGATMKGAVKIIRQKNPKRVLVATPVIAKEALPKLELVADEVTYLEAPDLFIALSEFYQEFPDLEFEDIFGFLG